VQEREQMKFCEFDLDDQIIQALDNAGYSECMPVQEQTLAHTIKGKDVFVQSQTGTGKTAAFLVSIFALLRGELKGKKALIIAPTRELAVQIEKEAILLGRNLGFNICSFYGGVGYGRQVHHLAQGIDIMIGTPGRILDFKKSGKINFKEIGIFVIDEADRLFDMGFLPDITTMLRSLNADCKKMLFSATLSREVRMIAREYMDNPAEVELCPEKVTVDTITQELYHVSKSEKMNLLLGILKKENPRTALIFTNMKDEARVVAERLRHNGFPCEHLSGDLPQKKRSRIVDEVKNGKISLLIATDVAARGIHIDDLDLVINYDIPEHCENYVHRIGRTARAGKTGKAVSLACEDYVHGLKAIEQFIGFKIPVMFADSELYLQDSSAGISFRKSRHRNSGRSFGKLSSGKSIQTGKSTGNISLADPITVKTNASIRSHDLKDIPRSLYRDFLQKTDL
jgi:ATP-dependent RNA helicase RhlB